MDTLTITVTKPQVPVAMWLLDRLAEEGVPAGDMILEKRKLRLPHDKEVVALAYHLLTYQYRALWEEDRSAVPTKPATAESMAYTLVTYARIDYGISLSKEELEELRGPSDRVSKGASETAMGRIRAALEAGIAKVGPKLYEELLEGYRRAAEEAYAQIMEYAQDPAQTGPMFGGNRRIRHYLEYVHYNEDVARKAGVEAPWTRTWETARTVPDAFRPDYAHAERRAKEAYENARDGFIFKNLKKFGSILGERQDLEDVTVNMKFRGNVFVGTVSLILSNAEVHGELSLKYVVRTIPQVTPYFQYPLVFTRAVVDGRTYRRPSERELQDLLRQES